MPVRYLVFALVGSILLGAFVFGTGGSDGRARGFEGACEQSTFIRAQTADPARATTVCSCILGWHLRAAGGGEPFLPLSLYTVDGPAAAAGLPDRTVDTDRRARSACVTGRVLP